MVYKIKIRALLEYGFIVCAFEKDGRFLGEVASFKTYTEAVQYILKQRS